MLNWWRNYRTSFVAASVFDQLFSIASWCFALALASGAFTRLGFDTARSVGLVALSSWLILCIIGVVGLGAQGLYNVWGTKLHSIMSLLVTGVLGASLWHWAGVAAEKDINTATHLDPALFPNVYTHLRGWYGAVFLLLAVLGVMTLFAIAALGVAWVRSKLTDAPHYWWHKSVGAVGVVALLAYTVVVMSSMYSQQVTPTIAELGYNEHEMRCANYNSARGERVRLLDTGEIGVATPQKDGNYTFAIRTCQ